MSWEDSMSPLSKKENVQALYKGRYCQYFRIAKGLFRQIIRNLGTVLMGTLIVREILKQKCWAKLTRGLLLLVHRAAATVEFLRTFGYTVLPHPSYSSNLATSDFLLFPRTKKLIQGKHFTLDKIISTVEDWFLSQSKDFYSKNQGNVVQRWEKLILQENDVKKTYRPW